MSSTPTESIEPVFEPVSFSQPEVQRNPFPFVKKLLAGERIYKDPLTGIPLVTRYEDIVHVYAHPKIYSSRNPLVFARTTSPVAGEVARRFLERGFAAVDTLVTNDPPSHRNFRRLVDRIFTLAGVRALEGDILRIADALLDPLVECDGAELIENFALKLPLFFITDQLGVPRSDWRKVKYWSDISIERITPVLPAERELKIADDLIEMQHYIWDSARAAERSGAQTLFAKLIRAEIDGVRLKPEEFINIATQIFTAGHETTTTLLGHAILLLLDEPGLRARLDADRSLIPLFIEEVLRLHPPVGGLRIAAEHAELAGTPIVKGSLVSLCTLTGNYDPDAFPHPDEVDLGRPNLRNHLSFGRGNHFCIGNLVARAEARIAIDRLLTRLPTMRLDPRFERPKYAAVYHVHALERLDVVF